MSCDNSNIKKNYIVTGTEQDILSACTGFYTNNIYNCSGDTIFIDPAFLDANTVIADTLSACTAIYTSNLYGCSPINVNDELYILSGLFLSGTPTTNTALEVLVRDTNGEVKIRDIDSIISGITTSANTYVTGTTFSSNQAVLTRNDGGVVFKLSGGSNVTLSEPSTNQILIDVNIPPGFNTFVTGFTYDDINTFRISQNDNTFFDATINILSGVTYYGDGSGLTNIPVSGVTNLQTELNNKVENGDNLGGGNEVFKNKSGTTLNFRTLSGGTNTSLTTIGDTIRVDVTIPPGSNTFVTGGTYNDITNTITLTRNDAVNINITGITDTYVTGVTLNGNTLELERNEGLPTLTVDLSSIDTNYYVTGGTYNSGTTSIDYVGTVGFTPFSVDVSELLDNQNTFLTAFTYDNANTFTIVRNDNQTFNATINNVTGFTINGDLLVTDNTTLSGLTTVYGDTPTSSALQPGVNNTYDLGAPSLRWREIWTTNLDATNVITTFSLFATNNVTVDNDLVVSGNTRLIGSSDYESIVTGTNPKEIVNVEYLTAYTENNDTFLTAFTYDNANTFTIVRNDNQIFNTTINTVTGLTINGDLSVTGTTNLDVINGNIFSGGTYYGDGSNLSGITTVDNYTTGATLVGDLLVFDRTDVQSAYTVSLSTLIVTGTTTTEIFLGDEEFTTNTAGRSVLTSTSTGFLSFAGSGQIDDAGVSFRIPLDYDSEPQFAVQWTMDGTSSTANTVNYNLNITTGNTTTINEHSVVSETVSIVDEAYSGTAWRILQTPFSSSTLNYSAGDYIHIELERDPANVNDTMIDTAYVSGLIFKYKANK